MLWVELFIFDEMDRKIWLKWLFRSRFILNPTDSWDAQARERLWSCFMGMFYRHGSKGQQIRCKTEADGHSPDDREWEGPVVTLLVLPVRDTFPSP
jgi:hypothetical protein